MRKTVLQIDMTIDENKKVSGGVHIEGEMLSIVAALALVSEKSPVLCEAIQKAAELNRRMSDENTAQNN